MHRYWSSKISCPDCNYTWTSENMGNLFNLKKVDFFWINRDHTSFEWFVDLLSQLEIEQQEHGGHMNRSVIDISQEESSNELCLSGSWICTCTSPPPSRGTT